MKNIICFTLLFCTTFLFSQKIDFNAINSNNVMKMMDEQMNIKSDNTKEFGELNKISKIVQIGNANTAEVYDKSAKSNLLMSQVGNFNTTLFVNPYTNQKTEQEIHVKGSNNYIDVTGSNSISQGMIININQSDKMVFIRNY